MCSTVNLNEFTLNGKLTFKPTGAPVCIVVKHHIDQGTLTHMTRSSDHREGLIVVPFVIPVSDRMYERLCECIRSLLMLDNTVNISFLHCAKGIYILHMRVHISYMYEYEYGYVSRVETPYRRVR